MSPQDDHPSIYIRLAKARDAEAIASVLYEAFAPYRSLYTIAAFSATTPRSDLIQQRMHEGPVWVAVQRGTIVGTVSTIPQGTALYIRSMAVRPAAQGQRVGELLIQQIERFAHAHGYTRLWLSSTPFLTHALRLYERVGFRRANHGPHELCGTPLVTLVKPLKEQKH